MSTPSVRRCVLVSSSLLLTLQLFALFASALFLVMAASDAYRDKMAKFVFTRLAERQHWRHLRRSRALEFYLLLNLAVQSLLFLSTTLMLLGGSRRLRFLMLPFLVVVGLGQVGAVYAVIALFLHTPPDAKLLALIILFAETFVVFPWWFGVLHLFGELGKYEESRVQLDRMLSSASMTYPNTTNDSAFSSLHRSIGANQSIRTSQL